MWEPGFAQEFLSTLSAATEVPGGGGGITASDFFADGTGTAGSVTATVPAHNAGDTIVVLLATAFNTLTLPDSDTNSDFTPLSVGATPSDAQLTQSATAARLYAAVDADNSISGIEFDWASGSSPAMIVGFILSGAATVGASATDTDNGGMDLTITPTENDSVVVAFAARRTSGDHTLIETFTREAGQDNGTTNGEAEVASYNDAPVASTPIQCTWSSGFSNNIYYLVEFVPA